jgi:hypothetical protein
MQYEVGEQELERMKEDASDRALLQMKLQDVTVLYQAFRDYLREHYMTPEEVLEVLAKEIVFLRSFEAACLFWMALLVLLLCR